MFFRSRFLLINTPLREKNRIRFVRFVWFVCFIARRSTSTLFATAFERFQFSTCALPIAHHWQSCHSLIASICLLAMCAYFLLFFSSRIKCNGCANWLPWYGMRMAKPFFAQPKWICNFEIMWNAYDLKHDNLLQILALFMLRCQKCHYGVWFNW